MCLLCLLAGLVLPVAADAEGDASPLAAFDRIWEAASAHVYPRQRQRSHFTPADYEALRRRAAEVPDLEALAREVVNPHLAALAVSHTHLYTHADSEYALFRSLFGTGTIDAPEVWHAGLQLLDTAAGQRVRAVLDGGPGAAAGFRRGDLIVAIDGQPGRRIGVLPSGTPVAVAVARG